MQTLLARPLGQRRSSKVAASPFSIQLVVARSERGPARVRALIREVIDGMHALPQRDPLYLCVRSHELGSLLFCANHVAVLEKWETQENEVFEEMKRLEAVMEKIGERSTTAVLIRAEHRSPVPKWFTWRLTDSFVGQLDRT